ncbi:retrovirus-related pol polyprotein from transposon TNT 1-94 [Tanacetum coccineum]
MPVDKTNKFSCNSTRVASSSSVSILESKDTNSKKRVLLNTTSKSTSKDVKKSKSSFISVANKNDTMNSNVSDLKTNVLKAKTVNTVHHGSNLVCVSCGKDVFMVSHDQCVACYDLSLNSRVKRVLFTSPVAAKSSKLGDTLVVAKSRFSVATPPKATNKVSRASPLTPESRQSRTLSTYMKNKIKTDQRLSISEEALGSFGKSQTYRFDSLLKISVERHPENIHFICYVQRIDTWAEGTTESRKQNKNKSKSWKIGKIKYMQNITCWNCNQKGHFQYQCSKLVASRDKVVNIAAGDSDDALVCCVKNTVEDRIMDYGISFQATYCKEELERFKLRSSKVCLADDKTLDIAGVGNVILKTSFGTIWTLKDVRYIPSLKRRIILVGQLDEEGYHIGFRDQQWKVTKGSLVVACGNKSKSLYMVEHQRLGDRSRIGMNMLASKGNVPDVRKVDIYFYKPGGLVKQKKLSFIMSEKTRQLQRADSVSMAYIIYRIPYVPIELRNPEEEWRGKDTSLTHLNVFGCEHLLSFRDTKSHQVIQSRNITFVDSIYGAKSTTNSSSLTKPIQKSQVVLVDISKNLAENDSIVIEHGLSSEITQSLSGSSDTSEGSENSRSFEDSRRSDEEDFEDEAFSEEGGSKTPQKKVNQSLIQKPCVSMNPYSGSRLLMKKWVKEEQDGRKRYKARLVVKVFLQIHRVDYNEIFSPVIKMTTIRLVLSIVASEDLHLEQLDVKTTFLHGDLDKDIYMTQQVGFQSAGKEENLVCKLKKSLDVHQVGNEREVEALRSFNWHPRELITEYGVLLERKAQVLKIWHDNGTEFKNATLKSYYEKLGILYHISIARTPQQNGVVECRN